MLKCADGWRLQVVRNTSGPAGCTLGRGIQTLLSFFDGIDQSLPVVPLVLLDGPGPNLPVDSGQVVEEEGLQYP